ncbi:MAG TPA: Hsp70 family protein [Thermoguttaceae bacterium]|nr:Hsp70 family protein [Thermoguttaceae bacterium]
MTKVKPVGIDLGTTNSAVAWVNPSGRSVMVRNSEGDLLTPSVVLFDDAEVVVGKEARNATVVHPDHVAEWVKRDMGSPVYSRAIRGEYLPPEVIQACVLRKLRADLVEALGPEVKVVITVPAYFDEPRRKATADAGEMARLSVLDIVNEPTAAALAFGEIHGYLSPTGGATDRMNVLVYDLGGGTFDVTLLRLQPGNLCTLATDGDVQLGGHDWDMRLVDYVAESFQRAHGVDPRHDPAALNRLYNEVIAAKHALSARSRATIRVEHGGFSDEIGVSRGEFEELTADLLERTAHTTRQLLVAARLQWADVSRLLLVGGATRMPMVHEMLQQMTGIAPDHTVNPDEAVARGAALYASHLLAEQAEGGPGSNFRVTNVNSHSLGAEGIEPETLRKANIVLIPRNTALPAKFTKRFITKRAGQRSIVIQVLEGESSLPDECTAIGRTVIRNLPPDLPQGWPVEVTFEYGANGRLTVHGVVPGTHHEAALSIERNVGLSREGVSRCREAVSSGSGFDAFESLVDEALGLDEAGAPSGTSRRPSADESAVPGASPGPPPEPPGKATAAAPPGPTSEPMTFYPEPDDATQPEGGPPPKHVAPPPGAGRQAAGAGRQPPARAADPEWARREPPVARRRRPIARWWINLIGFVVSAIVGLGLGYLVVSWLFPQSGLLRLW